MTDVVTHRSQRFDPELWYVEQTLEHALFDGPPPVIGRYEVLRPLDEGGMGVVFLARDPPLDRKVALKLLRSYNAGLQGRDQLLREARALARLSHAHIVQVYDVGLHEEHIFFAMEYIDGQTLDQWLGGAPRSWQALRELFLQIGRGLAAAHHAGIVHRDLSRRNILVDKNGLPKLVDFGLARVRAARRTHEAYAAVQDLGAPAAERTRPGSRPGTWPYMSPEQQNGEEATVKSDQYAYCLLLWEALYGEYPFPRDDEVTNLRAKASGPPDPSKRRPGAPRIPLKIHRVLQRGLAASPAARWPDMTTLLARLAGDPWTSRLSSTAVFVSALVVATAPWWRQDDSAVSCRSGVRQRFNTFTARLTDESYRQAKSLHLLKFAADLHDAENRLCDDITQAERREDLKETPVLAERASCLARRHVTLNDLAETLPTRANTRLRHSDYNIRDETLFHSTRRHMIWLPSIHACRDLHTPPDSAHSALDRLILPPELREHTRALAAASDLEGQGKFTEALDAIDVLLPRLATRGQLDLRAETLLARARVLRQLKRLDESALAISMAQLHADKARRDDLLAALRIEHVRLIMAREEERIDVNLARALRTELDTALAPLERLGESDPLRLEYLELAHVLAGYAKDRSAMQSIRRDALRVLRALSAMWERIMAGSRQSSDAAFEPLRQLSLRQMARLTDDPVTQDSLFDQAISSAFSAYGLNHVLTAKAAYDAAFQRFRRGDWRAGMRAMEVALSSYRQVYGERSPELAHAHYMAGLFLTRDGESERARIHAQTALWIGLASKRAEDITFSANLLRVIEMRRGEAESGLRAARLALHWFENPDDPPWQISLQLGEAEALLELERLDEVHSTLTRLKGELDRRDGDADAENRAELRLTLARTELARGQGDLARSTLFGDPLWEKDVEAMTDRLKQADYYFLVARLLQPEAPAKASRYADLAKTLYITLGSDGLRRYGTLVHKG